MESSFKREHVFFLMILLFSLSIVWPLIVPIGVGLVFGFVSESQIDWLQKTFKQPSKRARWGFAIVVLISILALFLVPTILISYVALSEFVLLLTRQDMRWMHDFGNQWAMWLSDELGGYGIQMSFPQIIDKVSEAILGISRNLITLLGRMIQGTPEILFSGVLMLMAWALFAVEGRRYRQILLPRLIPWERERLILTSTTAEVLRGVIVANVLVSFVQAILITTILGVMGIPRFTLWGVFGFFASFIPIIGTAPIMLGAAVYCYAEGRVPAALTLVIASIGVGGVDNILRPYFMKGSANLHFFWVLVAFVGGIAQFGLPGTLLGPLAFSLFVAALRMLRLQEEGEVPAIKGGRLGI